MLSANESREHGRPERQGLSTPPKLRRYGSERTHHRTSVLREPRVTLPKLVIDH